MAVHGSIAQLSIPLPQSLDTRVYLRLSTQAKAIVLCLTTASLDQLAGPKPMGSFVYALPDRFNPQQPLSTTLFSHEPTIEFATRLAKMIARKSQLPVYVTNSMIVADAGMGGTVEEEMDVLRAIVKLTLERLPAGIA
ncbi:hypothetical protein DCS_04057 [Drechmeria coniospora]|uniref:20S proteasome chaperone domain-containing protein n=1 Tax=Drechmeria coniospora TaxID=98403 RepID=A0A151GIW6_DRECN|nr:hypothetical protein DCS_04057 [Drechmeria coniospora]KYK57050.1 hypothetical protein DCS_04057 [Drechmeria coniospora]